MSKPGRYLQPFKVLTYILFTTTDVVRAVDGDMVEVDLGPLAQATGLQSYRLRDYLRLLEHIYFIYDLSLSYGKASFRIKRSPLMETLYTKEPS